MGKGSEHVPFLTPSIYNQKTGLGEQAVVWLRWSCAHILSHHGGEGEGRRELWMLNSRGLEPLTTGETWHVPLHWGSGQ